MLLFLRSFGCQRLLTSSMKIFVAHNVWYTEDVVHSRVHVHVNFRHLDSLSIRYLRKQQSIDFDASIDSKFRRRKIREKRKASIK